MLEVEARRTQARLQLLHLGPERLDLVNAPRLLFRECSRLLEPKTRELQLSFEEVDLGLIGDWVDLEKDVTFFDRRVGLHRNLFDLSRHQRRDRNGVSKDAKVRGHWLKDVDHQEDAVDQEESDDRDVDLVPRRRIYPLEHVEDQVQRKYVDHHHREDHVRSSSGESSSGEASSAGGSSADASFDGASSADCDVGADM